MLEEPITRIYYYPCCPEYYCNGMLLIKVINDNFSLDYECEKNKNHQKQNIYFKTFERFYLKEKEIKKCSKCNSTKRTHKCKKCNLYYCPSCSKYDAHLKEDTNNYIINSNECPIHNERKNSFCINCYKYICESCSEDEAHKNHKIEIIVNLIPSKNEVNEMINRLKYYDELIKLFEQYKNNYLKKDKNLKKNVEFNKKFENLLKNVVDEKNLIKKLIINFNTDFMSYAYNKNFEEIYNYTKTFNNDYLVDFYKSKNDTNENKTKILNDYFFKKKEQKIESSNPYLKKIYEGQIKKINDDYYMQYINLKNKINLIKCDQKGSLSSVKESNIEIKESIKDIFCEKSTDQIYKIYACLYEPKIIIIEFDTNKNIIYKIEDEIFYEDKNQFNRPFIKCIELAKSEYIATATSEEISLWVKKNDSNSKGYYEIRLFHDISETQDILLVDDEYFVASTSLIQVFFYNKNTHTKDKTINIKYSPNISNHLYLYKNYIFVVSRQGIGLISIKTKELVQYYNSGKNQIYLSLYFNNNLIYILTKKPEMYDYSDSESDDDENNINKNDSSICIYEYKMISGDLQKNKIFYPSNSDILKNDYENLEIEYLNSKNLLLLGSNVYKIEISSSREYYDDIRKSHVTKSGKCVIKKK